MRVMAAGALSGYVMDTIRSAPVCVAPVGANLCRWFSGLYVCEAAAVRILQKGTTREGWCRRGFVRFQWTRSA